MHQEDEIVIMNLEKLHTTDSGIQRIKSNLSLDTDDVIAWCKKKVQNLRSVITRKGKN